MPDHAWVESMVEKVVDEVLHHYSGQLRHEMVRRVAEEVGRREQIHPPTPAAAGLARAISEIQLGTSQKEILSALLNSCARYASRVALFVVKGSRAAGWHSRGFENGESMKDFVLDSTSEAVLRVLADRVSVPVTAGDFDARFFAEFGAPAGSDTRLLPLVFKNKVAALVYADAGTGEGAPPDEGALEVLMLATGCWLEVNALRKQVQKEPAVADSDQPVPKPTSAADGAILKDPFAGHAPAHAMAAAASAASQASSSESRLNSGDQTAGLDSRTAVGELQSVAPMAQAAAAPWPRSVAIAQAEGAASASPSNSAAAPAPAMSPTDEEIHRKAKRFARLLVDEIKLYNQSQVAEGLLHKDLYDRLKESIDKSRTTYQKRYGNTVAASGNYFEDEVKRSLAENDLSSMGPNFSL